MGMWGAGPFDNDDALDWVGEWADAEDLSPARDVMFEAALADEYFEAPDGARAVAAAALVAAALGDEQAMASLPSELALWLSSHPGVANEVDARVALVAIDRVLAGESELKELWVEDPSWLNGMDDLRVRLQRVAPPDEPS